MLSTSHSVVTKKRGLLLYAMSKRILINVRRVINAEMKAMTNPKKKTQAIEFISLITKLCLEESLSDITNPAERVPLMEELS